MPYLWFNAENLDAMIALQTKNKLGKSLAASDIKPPTGKQEEELSDWRHVEGTLSSRSLF